MMHDERTNPSPVYRAPAPVNMTQIRALQAGQPWPIRDPAPLHAAEAAAALDGRESTKLG